MVKNHMPEVAKMLSVAIGEEFDIRYEGGGIHMFGPYKFTEDDLVDCMEDTVDSFRLEGLLKGIYTIQKRPWRPKEGNSFWVVYPEGFVSWQRFSKRSPSDLAMLNMGNCFPTEESAEDGKEEIIAKFEEIKKGVRE